jgi:hypothetical protein
LDKGQKRQAVKKKNNTLPNQCRRNENSFRMKGGATNSSAIINTAIILVKERRRRRRRRRVKVTWMRG